MTATSNDDIPLPQGEAEPEVAKPSEGRKPSRREQYPPGIFTNDNGNLKFVAVVVRHPCKVFFTILIVNIIFCMILIRSITDNPFSDPGSQYDTNDIRSIEYDSLRLAQEDVEEVRDESFKTRRLLQQKEDSSMVKKLSRSPRRKLQGGGVRIQEQALDFTYWVYEAESSNEKGLFGTAESIWGMKESQALYREDAGYTDFCWREYTRLPNSTEETYECRLPLTPLNIYYASNWDTEIADFIISELSEEGNVQRYNDLSICVEFNLLCDLVPNTYTDDDFLWTFNLNNNITAMTDYWDGEGELVEENIEQITTLVAHLMQLITKRGFVDFGFDKGFSLENPVSFYSRALFTWGGPLEQSSNAVVTSEDEREDLDEDTLTEYVSID